MSSIMRRRNGLMHSSVMGYSCLNRGCWPLDLQTGRPVPLSPPTSVPTAALRAALYRASGFVLWPLNVVSSETARRPELGEAYIERTSRMCRVLTHLGYFGWPLLWCTTDFRM